MSGRDIPLDAWNTRPHPSPWLNAPIPEEGELQELIVDDRGRWCVAFEEKFGNRDAWPRGCNGGPARIERRWMENGRLVYGE